jgi:light-dependent protochlorophyllide reductase
MSSRTVLITGGTSGLGLRAAAELARDRSWHVVITGKDEARAARAAEAIGAEGLALDLGSLEDVRRVVIDYLAGERPPLQALVCNAGVQHIRGLATSSDGYEATFAVNHLGHFLLANLLVDHMQPGARVVVVSSDTHDPAKKTGMPVPRFERALELAQPDLKWAGGDSPATAGRRRYTTSKLCNVLFTYEAARRWEPRGITVNAFNPGMMPGTGLARDYPPYQQMAWRYLMPALTLLSPGVNTPQKSGKALARLVTDPSLVSRTGTYWSGEDSIASSAESHDVRRASELWDLSNRLAHLV